MAETGGPTQAEIGAPPPPDPRTTVEPQQPAPADAATGPAVGASPDTASDGFTPFAGTETDGNPPGDSGSPEQERRVEDSPFVEAAGYLDDAFYAVHAETTAKSVERAGPEASDVREILTVELDYGDGEKTEQNDQFLIEVITGEDGESSEIIRGTLAALETITDSSDANIDPQVLEVAIRAREGLAGYVLVENNGESISYKDLTTEASRLDQLGDQRTDDDNQRLAHLRQLQKNGTYHFTDEAQPPEEMKSAKEASTLKSYKDRLKELEAKGKAGKLKRSEQKELGRLRRRSELEVKIVSAETALTEAKRKADAIKSSFKDLEASELAIKAEIQALNDPTNTDPEKATKIAERRAELARIPLRRAQLQQEQLDVDKGVKSAEQEVQHFHAVQTLYTEQDRITGQLKEIKDGNKRQEARRVLTALELATHAEGPYGLAIVDLALKNAQRVGHDTTVSSDTNDYLMRNVPSADQIAQMMVTGSKGEIDPKLATEFAGALFSGDVGKFLNFIQSHPEILHKEKGDLISRQFFGQLSESDAYKAIRDIVDPGDRAMMRKKLRKGGLTVLGLLAYLTYGLIIEPSAEGGLDQAMTPAAGAGQGQ